DGALFLDETDDQTATEVSYDNTTSGLTANEAQAAIDELAASNAADNDTDDTNEIQDIAEGNGITVTPSGQDFEVAVTNPIVAMGRFEISGTTNTVNSNVTTIGPGNYRVNLTSTPLPSDYVVQLTIINGGAPGDARTIQVTTRNTNFFEVQVYESSGVAAPSDWYYTVTAF
ncbi:MAG: hypothetical protein ACX93O_15945, partial [Flagellimonas sp.]